MKCPFCKHEDSKVLDSRSAADQNAIRRRRQCLDCEKRFTTYETVEQLPLAVVKRDGRREPFRFDKLLLSLQMACHKRRFSISRLKEIAADIENEIRTGHNEEVHAEIIGELVMNRLKQFDQVAYVRFTSIYKKFELVTQISEEIDLLKTEKKC